MFNPLYPFTIAVLEQTVKRGCIWFVRNTFLQAFDHFDENIKGYYIISHYHDKAKAEAHFNSIGHDPHRFLYSWHNADHQQRLKAAADKPVGYKVYSSYFVPGYKDKISKKIRNNINKYINTHKNWKPVKGEPVNVDLYLQFGMLYLHLKYRGEELKINFAEIQNEN